VTSQERVDPADLLSQARAADRQFDCQDRQLRVRPDPAVRAAVLAYADRVTAWILLIPVVRGPVPVLARGARSRCRPSMCSSGTSETCRVTCCGSGSTCRPRCTGLTRDPAQRRVSVAGTDLQAQSLDLPARGLSRPHLLRHAPDWPASRSWASCPLSCWCSPSCCSSGPSPSSRRSCDGRDAQQGAGDRARPDRDPRRGPGVRYALKLRKKSTLRDSVIRRARNRGTTDFWALRNVSFQVAHGESLGVIGPTAPARAPCSRCWRGSSSLLRA